MKFKLLKDNHLHKAGTIILWESNSQYIIINGKQKHCDRYSINDVMNNPDWFEEVKEPVFEKKLCVNDWGKCFDQDSKITVSETFETLEQGKAWMELRKHIYKFPEPVIGKKAWYMGSGHVSTIINFGGHRKLHNEYKFEYHMGYMLSYEATENDAEKRKELINNYLKTI